MVLAASILLLPVFDDWLPGSLVLALVCLAWRLIRLFPRTYNQYQQRLTARSIQTAVDCLDEGILISWEKGEPVLVNFTMYAVMEQRNEEMKEVLDGLVAFQTKQTTESLRYKIHDLFAVRCRSQPARTAGCPGDDIPQLGRRCGRNGDLADRYPTGR